MLFYLQRSNKRRNNMEALLIIALLFLFAIGFWEFLNWLDRDNQPRHWD
jgi:hypothetical protein